MRRADWRLVPAAVALWFAALVGQLVHWGFATAVGVVVTGVALAILVHYRATDRLHAAWPLLVAGVLAVVPVGERLRAANDDPLRALAHDRAALDLRIEVLERPRPIRSPGYAGTPSGVRTVVIPARVLGTGEANGAEAGRRKANGNEAGGNEASGEAGGEGAGRGEAGEGDLPGSEVGGTGVSGSEVGGTEVGRSEVGGSERGGGEVGGGEVVVFAPAEHWAGLLPGQQATAEARLAPAEEGGLIVARVNVRGPPSDVDPPGSAQRVAAELRQGLRETARAVLGDEAAGLLPALVVGDTDGLLPEVRADFDTAGMTHLLAVSGANLAIVGFAALFLLRLAGAGPWLASAGAGAAMVGFVVLAGPEPSVLRAAVMGLIGLLALALGKEKSALPALAVAVIGLVAVDPGMAVAFGFALSVLATGGLVLIAPRWARALERRRVPPGVAEALAVPTAAQLVTAPVVAGMSGQVSLVAVLANLVAAPVVAPATVLGVLAALVAPVWGGAAQVLVAVAGPEVGWLIAVAEHAAAVPGAALAWPAGWWGGLLAAAAVAVVVLVVRLPKARALVALGLVGVLLVAVPVRVALPGWPPEDWAAVACDVGQGDALVLATDEPGRAVLVDAGPEPGPVGECLDRLGVTGLAAVVLTHLHADHVGGLVAGLAREPAAVLVGPGRAPGWAWDRVRAASADAGVPVVELTAGRRLDWPGLTIDVLHPEGGGDLPADADGSEINNRSLVLLARTAAGRVLVTGDIELDAQAELLGSGVGLAAEVVKVPHHGSRFSDPGFLAAVRPRVALVSVGVRNRYGHPAPATLAVLDRIGARTARTDLGGDVAVVAGGGVVLRGPAVTSRGRRAPPRCSAGRSPWGRCGPGRRPGS